MVGSGGVVLPVVWMLLDAARQVEGDSQAGTGCRVVLFHGGVVSGNKDNWDSGMHICRNLSKAVLVGHRGAQLNGGAFGRF